jgi:hypothetical protein
MPNGAGIAKITLFFLSAGHSDGDSGAARQGRKTSIMLTIGVVHH